MNEGSWEQAAIGRTRSGNARGETEEEEHQTQKHQLFIVYG